MSIAPHLQLLLHLIDRHAGCTVVELTEHLKPFAPAHNPISQLSVRSHLKTLMESRLVQYANLGKPRLYIRTQASYRMLPASWTPDATQVLIQRPKSSKR